jgi:hypothetical protein
LLQFPGDDLTKIFVYKKFYRGIFIFKDFGQVADPQFCPGRSRAMDGNSAVAEIEGWFIP